MADYDLAIIGGGLNGVSIARDAAGRGLRTILLEQGDLGAGASSAASPLIQGDLRDLEQGGLLPVRRALAERDIWLRTSPHLVHPARFVVPMHADMRPPWLWRLGLAAHDRLARGGGLPAAETIDLTHHPLGDVLKRPFGLAVSYWGGIADGARLTVLTAMDAAERGAVIWTGAKCVRADRSDIWRLVVINRGQRQIVLARALVNAAGGWIASVAETVLRVAPPRVRLMQSSQIVVRRLFDHDGTYVLQNPDRRLVHAVPFERDFTLIGTAERDFAGDPAMVSVSSQDAAYLRDAANRYFREQLGPSDVIHTLAGVNVVDIRAARSRVPPDGFVGLQRRFGEAPLLTMFGGATTTVRRRAETAMAALAPFFAIPGPWTAREALPGGNLPSGDLEDLVDAACDRWPFLPPVTVRRVVSAYGTRIETILDGARGPDDLGPDFGEGLSGREVRYLMGREWARFADDVLWRRSRLGLTLTARDREALALFMKSQAAVSC
jgi:glycerol-3-phosphate dehydrogenase